MNEVTFKVNILIVEDEVSLANAIKQILEKQGWRADAVHDGNDAVDYATGFKYDVIILDVMLPGMDGFQVIKSLRKAGLSTPVLMLTAKSTTADKVTGLTYGADDYMTKPFETEELIARIIAVSRRRGEVVLDTVSYGDLELDLVSGELRRGGESVQLSKKEFELAALFFRNPGNTLTKESIIVSVWGYDSEATDNNVEAYISFLRRKFRFLKSRVTVKNIQKIGYRLEENA